MYDVKFRYFFFGAILILCSNLAAFSCETALDDRDDPIVVFSDGSFENSGLEPEMRYFSASADWDYLSGGPVRDVSTEKVAQKIIIGGGCNITELLLFTDCSTAQNIMISADIDLPPCEGSGCVTTGVMGSWISNIQPPKGPIALRPQSTVESLAAVADKHGIEYAIGVEWMFTAAAKRDRYNPFAGCQLFYPESLGAQAVR